MCMFREKKGSIEERNQPAVGCASNTRMNMHLLADNWVLDGERTVVKIQQDSKVVSFCLSVSQSSLQERANYNSKMPNAHFLTTD